MIQSKKVQYMRIGLSLCGIPVSDRVAEIIVEVNEGIQKKKGEFSITDAVDIELRVNRKYDKKKIKVTAQKN
jgi:hypothetical protein